MKDIHSDALGREKCILKLIVAHRTLLTPAYIMNRTLIFKISPSIEKQHSQLPFA